MQNGGVALHFLYVNAMLVQSVAGDTTLRSLAIPVLIYCPCKYLIKSDFQCNTWECFSNDSQRTDIGVFFFYVSPGKSPNNMKFSLTVIMSLRLPLHLKVLEVFRKNLQVRRQPNTSLICFAEVL